MDEPLVSVHMITYNHAPYIAQAIEGVLMQKFTKENVKAKYFTKFAKDFGNAF